MFTLIEYLYPSIIEPINHDVPTFVLAVVLDMALFSLLSCILIMYRSTVHNTP